MPPETLSRRTIVFVNIAHAFDHFVLLIYPTAVLAIAAERQLAYGDLIGLATGAFVAFGLCALPMGWFADWIGRRNLLAVFFVGYGASCLGMSTADSAPAMAAWLLVLGVFSAIYHPIGSAMLVTHARQLGRDLGWNGVWGNVGAAVASIVTAFLAATLGWRAAFILPGLVCIATGLLFLAMVPGDGQERHRGKQNEGLGTLARPLTLLAVFAVAVMAGGLTFNVTTIALPKVIDEGIGASLPLTLTGSLATAAFLVGAAMQLGVGRLIDRYSLPHVFLGLSVLQPAGLALAATTSGLTMYAGLVCVMAAIYGQVVINDAMVARYVPASYRAKAFSLRYFVGFTASGFAVPMIAFLHARGGFPAVLAMTALFGAVITLSALAFNVLSRPRAA